MMISLAILALCLLFAVPAWAGNTCSTVGPISTAIHVGDRITARVQACATLPDVPGLKRIDFWPRAEAFTQGGFATSEISVGCPAGAWSGPIKTLTWTTFRTSHPVIDLQWYYFNGGWIRFDANVLNNGCKVWFEIARPTTSPCDPMSWCQGNTVMFCQDLAGTPVAASSCVSGPFGMVVPASFGGSCACSTVMLIEPLPPEVKAMWRAISTFSMGTAAFFAGLNLGGWPPATEGVTRGLALILYRLGPPAAALAVDPYEPDWINPTPLILQPVPTVTPTTGLTPTMVSNMQTLLAKWEQATAKIEAASVALNRYLSAVADNGPGYQDMHLDEYDQYATGAQIALGKLADLADGMNDPSLWKKGNVDLRPLFVPLYNARADLRAWSVADLRSQ